MKIRFCGKSGSKSNFLKKGKKGEMERARERKGMGRERVAEGESKRERESKKETEAVLEDTESPSFSVCLPVALFLSKKRNRRLKFNQTQVFAKCNAKAKNIDRENRSRKQTCLKNWFRS